MRFINLSKVMAQVNDRIVPSIAGFCGFYSAVAVIGGLILSSVAMFSNCETSPMMDLGLFHVALGVAAFAIAVTAQLYRDQVRPIVI